MLLSVTTDYATDSGCPEPALRRIAEAGFTHIHWCHHWSSDFVYSHAEVDQILRWMKGFGLKLTDLHGSIGPEKNWGSPREYERLAGVELVLNRIEMTAWLGGDVVIMHLPAGCPEGDEEAWTRFRRSMDALEPYASIHAVRIAIENGGSDASFDAIERVFGMYGPEFVGLCYDSGHGNLFPGGLDRLAKLADRLISVHLHDNQGTGDDHNLPFSGTVDWERLTGILARSGYTKWISEEVSIRNSGLAEEPAFLTKAFETAQRLQEMVDATRGTL
ncbi:MAG TPA: sugar phosphate isomerase/epimerase family protein [Armatimonadota bacterium]|nr:sugar phosphate isomerase/epimerase family protein [Armatimonadota bacterium]HQK95474.1 sugar phosphate isomerase/epimerase family protein [Armatimonadota bacterium]